MEEDGDAPEEGTGMLHCQGFASSREMAALGLEISSGKCQQELGEAQPACCAWLSSDSELTSLQSPGQGVTAATGLGGAAWAQGMCCWCPSHGDTLLGPSGPLVSFLPSPSPALAPARLSQWDLNKMPERWPKCFPISQEGGEGGKVKQSHSSLQHSLCSE